MNPMQLSYLQTNINQFFERGCLSGQSHRAMENTQGSRYLTAVSNLAPKKKNSSSFKPIFIQKMETNGRMGLKTIENHRKPQNNQLSTLLKTIEIQPQSPSPTDPLSRS